MVMRMVPDRGTDPCFVPMVMRMVLDPEDGDMSQCAASSSETGDNKEL